jgi:hypothetical protein
MSVNAYNQQYQQWLAQNQAQGNQLTQGMGALLQDVQANNQSQQLQFQQGQGLFAQNQDLLGQIPGMIQGTANQTSGQLEQQAGQTLQTGQQGYDDLSALYERNRTDLLGTLGDSVADFERARDEYRDMSAQTTSAMLSGMQNDIRTRMDQLGSGIGPDGNVMSPAEVQAARHQMQSDWQSQRYQVASQVMEQQNQVRANLQQAVGQARLGAAGTQAGFDASGLGTMAAASQQRLQARDMANNLYAHSASIRNGAQILSIDRQMAGMQFGAQLAQQFPYSPTSMFDVFLSMQQLQQSGAQRRTPFALPQQFQA